MILKNYPEKFYHWHICKMIALLLLLFAGQRSTAQNTCATAVPITAGTYTVAAIDGANIATGCSGASLAEWYVYTPAANHSVTVTSDLAVNICKDTNFSVYTGTCAGLTCYTQDDDSGIIACSSGGTSYLSFKTFDAIAGNTYYIAWDNQWSAVGFQFQLSEAPLVPSPCSLAIPVTAGITTVPAIDGANVSTACSTATLAKWYVYTPTQAYHVTITSDLAANICKDTNFSVYTGSCPSGLTCVASDDNSGVLACNSGNTFSNLSTKSFDVAAGTTYYIAWDNKWSAAGFDFQITEGVIVVPVNYNSQTISSINSTYKMCIVDMNNDGKDDIVGVSDNNLRIHYQGAAGALTVADFPISGTSQMPSWSIAAGDYNKDGYNDLLLGSGGGLTFWKSNSTGTAYTSVTPGEYIFCQRTNFVDIDNDGNLDAFSCHDVDPNVYYINNGSGGFTYYQSGITPGAYSLGVTPSGGNYASLWTDLDNDGDVDMFISKCSGPPCEIHRNDGNSFTDISAVAQINFQPVQSWSSAVNDFDNDGDMDILVGSNGSVGSRLFRNNLDTTNSVEEAYTDITLGSGWDISSQSNRDYVSYDFDNDGHIDVLGGGSKIMFNQGDGSFAGTTYPSISVGAVGDLNSDGFLDILNGSTVRYGIPNGNKWFTVSLHGIQSNSNGIGARVEIYGAWGKQIRDIRSGEGFGYMSSLNAYFGLGSANAITQVIVRWPSGVVDTIINPAVNQSLSVVEGTTLATNQLNNSSFSVYPNPADDILNIRLGSTLAALQTAQIFDLNGRSVASPLLSNNAFSVKNLSSGTYILLLKTIDGKQYTQKFLKR